MRGWLLDTNVISELRRPTCDAQVRAWADSQLPTSLYLSRVTIAEIRYGIEIKPQGRRRRALEAALDAVLALVDRRVLPLDERSATFAAEIRATQKKAGITVETPDNLIAGIARSFEASVATRNVADFRRAGVTVTNPWRGE